MKKFSFKSCMVVIAVIALMVTETLTASADGLKSADFIDVFGTGSIVGTESNGMVPVTWENCGGRVSYMQPIALDGMKIVLKNLNIGAPQSSTDSRGLWFTFSQEAGHYWGAGATGVHFRLTHNGTNLSLSCKQADDMNDAPEHYYLRMEDLSLKGWPATLTIQVNKVGADYEVSFNGVVAKIPADKVDSRMSPSGKCFINMGIDKPSAGGLTFAEIINTKAPAATTTIADPVLTTASADVTPTTDIRVESTSVPNGDTTTTAKVGSDVSGSVDNEGGIPWLPIVIAVAIVAIGGGAVAFFVIKRKRSSVEK